MLQIQDVTKQYQNFVALEHINLEFENGIYGLLAPNGAGKTTLLKLITTLLFPTEGKILYDGVDIRKLDGLYREKLGFLPQDFGYYRDYTPEKYLYYIGVLKGMEKRKLQEKIGQMLDLVGLTAQKKKKMKKFSGGMIQRVGIAQALLNDPQILVLDEPTAGLDPKERMRFRKILTSLSKDKTVLISTHIVSDVEFIANHVVLIKDKKVYCNDTAENICKKLEGCIFETTVEEKALLEWENRFQVVSRRREGNDIIVRFISREAKDGWRPVSPGLEDVFLYLYKE